MNIFVRKKKYCYSSSFLLSGIPLDCNIPLLPIQSSPSSPLAAYLYYLNHSSFPFLTPEFYPLKGIEHDPFLTSRGKKTTSSISPHSPFLIPLHTFLQSICDSIAKIERVSTLKL